MGPRIDPGWEALQERFDAAAAAAGHPKGSLGYYAFSITVSREDNPLLEELAARCREMYDELLRHSFLEMSGYA